MWKRLAYAEDLNKEKNKKSDPETCWGKKKKKLREMRRTQQRSWRREVREPEDREGQEICSSP